MSTAKLAAPLLLVLPLLLHGAAPSSVVLTLIGLAE
jgi:hypothetical protein